MDSNTPKIKAIDERIVWLEFRDKFVDAHSRLECFYCLKILVSDTPLYVKKPKDRLYRRRKVSKKIMATVDHVQPLSKGGARYELANLVICCDSCNGSKGDLTLNEWVTNNPVIARQIQKLKEVCISKKIDIA